MGFILRRCYLNFSPCYITGSYHRRKGSLEFLAGTQSFAITNCQWSIGSYMFGGAVEDKTHSLIELHCGYVSLKDPQSDYVVTSGSEFTKSPFRKSRAKTLPPMIW